MAPAQYYKDQGDDNFYTFTKILAHCKLPGGKIKVEVLWDNGETSWEPQAVLHKDDPVTIAAYARDHKLLDQQG